VNTFIDHYGFDTIFAPQISIYWILLLVDFIFAVLASGEFRI
jgi:hypothetical protein